MALIWWSWFWLVVPHHSTAPDGVNNYFYRLRIKAFVELFRMPKTTTPVHPGRYLLHFLEQSGLSQTDFSKKIKKPIPSINEIIQGRRGICARTALDFEKHTNVPANVWMAMDSEWKLHLERKKRRAKPPVITAVVVPSGPQ